MSDWPEVIFFDVGYTLLRPKPSFEEAFAAACAEAGVRADLEAVTRAEGAVWQEATAAVPHYTLSPQRSRQFWVTYYHGLFRELGLGLDGDFAYALYDRFSDPARYALYPETLSTLKRLRSLGCRLGIISNWEAWLPRLLARERLDAFFSVTVISALAGVEKPDPAIFRLAVEGMRVEPSRCLHVGDSLECDVEPARSLGIRPILVDRRDRHPQAPCPRIRSLDEILPLVESVLSRGGPDNNLPEPYPS